MRDERSEGFQGREGDSDPRSLLDAFDRVVASLPPGDPVRRELLDLRPEISDREETLLEARRVIEKLEEVVKKVPPPANRIGTFLGRRRNIQRTSSWEGPIIIATLIRASRSQNLKRERACSS